jgi:NitT/TauT family transport system substrate-binding protein
MSARLTRSGLLAGTLLAATLAAAGCAGARGPTSASGPVGLAGATAAAGGSGPNAPEKPEKRDLVVATMPGESTAGLYIAQQDGLFRGVGLNVTIRVMPSTASVIASVANGGADVASAPYTSYIAADAAGAHRATIRILAAGYSLGTRAQEIMVGPRSTIPSVAGLRGATIAVDAVNSETTDLLYTVLATCGIRPSQVHVVSVPFPAMPGELAAGQVGAIYEVEPYVTEAAEQHGDVELADADAGAAQGLPISGYGVLASWAARYPRTARAFAAAIRQANTIAATSPGSLEKALGAALHLSPIVTAVMATGTFPTATFAAQLQRVADLMLRYGQLSRPFSVRPVTGL